jgi:hypothetical protein
MISKILRRSVLFMGILLLSVTVFGPLNITHPTDLIPGLEIPVNKRVCPDCLCPEGKTNGGSPYWNQGASPGEGTRSQPPLRSIPTETQWIEEGVREALGR